MINRDEIEPGDKVYTRDGGCLVARDEGGVCLGTFEVKMWKDNGLWFEDTTHPLDIIRIEKAPKPVVEEVYLCSNGGNWCSDHSPNGWVKAIKLDIIRIEKAPKPVVREMVDGYRRALKAIENHVNGIGDLKLWAVTELESHKQLLAKSREAK